MDFQLNETQSMIQEGARRLLENSFPPEKARAAEASADGFSREIWKQMAELGWTGAALPEEVGGGGCGNLELCVLAEELGRAAASTPLVVTAGFAATALQKVEQNEATHALLGSLATSDTIITQALAEPGGRDERSAPTSLFKETAAGGTVSGTKIMVPFASAASLLLVSLSTSDGELVLAGVESDADGVTVKRHQTLGGDPLFRVELADVTVSADHVFARGAEAQRAIDAALDAATILATAEAVGNCEKMVLIGSEYTSTREQFGVKIGSFQAVAHPLANMRIHTDACRLLAAETGWLLDSGEDAALEVAATKVFANEVIVEMIHAAHAVHGAIGYTMEYDLQLFTRRARAFCLSYGDTAGQTERAAVALGL